MTDATATTSESFSVKLTHAERQQLNDLAAAHGRMSAGAYLRLLIAKEHAALLQGQRGIPAPAPRKPTPADLHALVQANRKTRVEVREVAGLEGLTLEELDQHRQDIQGLAYEPLDEQALNDKYDALGTYRD